MLYCIVNLDTRAVITRRAGDIIFNVCRELAQSTAEIAQHMTGAPHAVLPWPRIDGGAPPGHPSNLAREIAPWAQ